MSKADTRHRSLSSFALRVGLVFIIAIAAVYLVLLADLQRVVKSRRERLYAMGVPRTWADVAPPEISDKDNAAVLYVVAFGRLDRTSAGSDLRYFLYGNAPGERKRLRPSIEGLLARNRAALDLIKQAGAKPRSRFPIEWEAALDGRLLQLWGARWPARLLAADAIIAAEDGDTARAVESCRAGLRMSGHVAGEPTFTPFHVGVEIQAITLRHLQDVLQQAELTPSQCRILYDELKRLDWARYFNHTAPTEGRAGLWYFETVRHQPSRGWALITTGTQIMTGRELPGVVAARPLLGLYLSPLGRGLRLKEEIAYCDRLERSLNLMRRPFPQGPAACNAAVTSGDKPPWYFFISGAITDSSLAPIACYRAIGYRNAMQVALALGAYHSRRGTYPDTLDALRKYPGWRVPEDPYSGKPFVYKREGAGFILYSFGEDMDDDGGRPFRGFGLDGDWVWKFEK